MWEFILSRREESVSLNQLNYVGLFYENNINILTQKHPGVFVYVAKVIKWYFSSNCPQRILFMFSMAPAAILWKVLPVHEPPRKHLQWAKRKVPSVRAT